MTAPKAGERKVPRVDLRKLLAGGVAGRREAVTLVGDALREHGAIRVEGHRVEGHRVEGHRVEGHSGNDGSGDSLEAVGRHLLEALGEYFGLAAGAFAKRVVDASGRAEGAVGAPVLRVLATVPTGTELRQEDGEWRAVGAHPGELLAVPGPGLAALTGGVVPAAALRLRVDEKAPVDEEAVTLWLAAGEGVVALPEFESATGSTASRRP